LEQVIAADDGRLQAVRNSLQGLPPGSRIADVGCGGGRYLHWLVQWFPQYCWTGIDASPAALSRTTPSVERLQGSLLELPVADDHFDAVFCVEALEHALLPEQAIAELCRVTRPGGRVLVIDKQQRRQRLSHHQPWEIWFKPDEVCSWLQPACEHISVTPLCHGPHHSRGLFLAWAGERRPANRSALLRAA
jgi:malonyl-CoA O-methyltransferase